MLVEEFLAYIEMCDWVFGNWLTDSLPIIVFPKPFSVRELLSYRNTYILHPGSMVFKGTDFHAIFKNIKLKENDFSHEAKWISVLFHTFDF